MRFVLTCSVPLFALLTACTKVKETPATVPQDKKLLVGTWCVVKAELGGNDRTEMQKDVKFIITDDGKYVTDLGKDGKEVGTITVDSTKNPNQMNLTPSEGSAKGNTAMAIYKLDGDTLTVCYGAHGGDRPQTFDSGSPSEGLKNRRTPRYLLITYAREN